ncbi:uncharacterized protein LY89DRAFT_591259, partial [Mollisia scopiformis]
LTCLAALVPEYCGSLTNSTCICTSTEIAAALTPCAIAACNVTESLQLERYSAESCGIANDKTRYYQQIRLYAVVAPLTTILVAARIFARCRIDIGLGPDDWMIVAAQAAYLTDVGTGLTIAVQGFGEHTFWLTIAEVSKALKFFYISELFYLLAITLTKLSLLLFFRRIFPSSNFRMMILAMGVFVVVSNFSLAMALCFQCIPFYGIWTNWIYKVAPVKCINVFACVYVAAGMSIFHDLVILTMPLSTLWGLNLHWQKKAHLIFMFSVGSFVIVCSALPPGLTSSPDDQAPIAVWTDLEISVGIICACLPACRSLVGYVFPNLKMSLGSSGPSHTTSAYPAKSANHARYGSKGRPLTNTRSFIELDDRTESQDTLEEGRKKGVRVCETPVQDKLNPDRRDAFGHRALVEVEAGGMGERRMKTGNTIVMTTTVDQSERRL